MEKLSVTIAEKSGKLKSSESIVDHHPAIGLSVTVKTSSEYEATPAQPILKEGSRRRAARISDN